MGSNGVAYTIGLGSPPRGVTAQTGDIDEAPLVPLTVDIASYYYGDASGALAVEAITWDEHAEPYNQPADVGTVVRIEPDEVTWTDSNTFVAAIPTSTNYVRVIDTENGNEEIFPIATVGEASTITLAWGNYLGPLQEVTGTLAGDPDSRWCIGQPAAYVGEITIYSVAGSGTDEETRVEVGSYLVFPNADGTFSIHLRQRVALPDEDKIVLQMGTHPAYSPWSMSVWDEWEIDPADFGETTLDIGTPGVGCAV